MPSNVAAALACFPLVGGIIFYILEKRDGFVRFYAMQSIIFGAAWFLFNISVLDHAWNSLGHPGDRRDLLAGFWALASALVQIAFLIVLIIAIVKAFSGVRWEIPWVGPIARKQTNETLWENVDVNAQRFSAWRARDVPLTLRSVTISSAEQLHHTWFRISS